MTKKLKMAYYSASVSVMLFPALVAAQYKEPAGTNLPSGTVYNIIKGVMNWLLGLVGVIGVIGFCIAGVLYLTAAGEQKRIDTAKSAMLYSVIGVVVALLGLVILRFAQGLLGGQSTTF